MDFKDMEIGRSVFYSTWGNRKQSLLEVKKIGRKYITAGSIQYGDLQFDLETGREKSDSPGTLYESEEAYQKHLSDRQRANELRELIRGKINWAPIEQLEAIALVLANDTAKEVAEVR
jgi:hypothetical protein